MEDAHEKSLVARIRTGVHWIILVFMLFVVAEAVLNFRTVRHAFSTAKDWKTYAAWVHKQFPLQFAGKERWIDGNGLLMRCLGRRLTNKTLKYRGGLLEDSVHARRDAAPRASELVKWDAFMKSLGGRYLYVQAPMKLDRKLEMLPPGRDPKTQTAWEGVDELLRLLNEAGVPCLDLGPGLVDDLEAVARNFYRTDHHWRYEAAFSKFPEVARTIASLARKDLPDDCLQLDAANWKQVSLKRSFLGSQGRRTGAGFAGYDDFTYFLPTFPTDIDFVFHRQPLSDIRRRGPFDVSIIDQDRVRAHVNSHKTSRYSCYCGAGHFPISIKSQLAPCDLKLLVIKDSFTIPMIGFLSTVFTDIEVIDPRGYSGSVADFARAFHPDVMMTLVNAKALGEMKFFAFDATEDDRSNVGVVSRVALGTIEKRESASNYGYARAKCRLKPGASYRLSIESLNVEGDDGRNEADVVLYDMACKKRLDRWTVRGDFMPGQWQFSVPADARNPQLLFYAGHVGMCLGCSVRYEGVVLDEIKGGL